MPIDRLRTESVIASDATVTILEISKTSPVSLRLFDVDDTAASNPNVLNPQVGGYLLGHDNDAYLCTTGGRSLGRARSTRCMCGSWRGRLPLVTLP